MKRLLLVLSLLTIGSPLFPERNLELDLRRRINEIRLDNGLAILKHGEVLDKTAAAYAQAMHEHSRLAHRDRYNRTALDRYRAMGGTRSIIGEIIGSGPNLERVVEAWLKSDSHRNLILKSDWTHLGYGSDSDRRIWVVLFTIARTDHLRIEKSAGGYSFSGKLIVGTTQAQQPVLLSGITEIEPLFWDRASGVFRYHIPAAAGALYHRLGFISSDGMLKITDVFYPERLLTFFLKEELQ